MRPERSTRRLRRRSNGALVAAHDASLLARGGEGSVYTLAEDEGLVAKVYHRPSGERARKLEIMVAHPPEDPTTVEGHHSFAWPLDLLTEDHRRGEVVGFLMPRVRDMRPAFRLYNPASRRDLNPLFDYFYLHRAARNVASAAGALHACGYVMGDVNESNFMVAPTALVTIVDADSFQVRDPESGASHRCRVGKPEFTPPELQGTTLAAVDRTAEHDRFGLAVLLFQMLMEGVHPFSGVFRGEDDPPPVGSRIASGHCPWAARPGTPFAPPPIAPPFELLHPDLRRLFLECFDEGHRDPARRPTAGAWQEALTAAEAELVACRANTQHRYGNHLETCPWCERAAAMKGRDPFPSRAAVSANKHRRRRKKKKPPVAVARRLSMYPPPPYVPGPPGPPSLGLPSVWPGGPVPATGATAAVPTLTPRRWGPVRFVYGAVAGALFATTLSWALWDVLGVDAAARALYLAAWIAGCALVFGLAFLARQPAAHPVQPRPLGGTSVGMSLGCGAIAGAAIGMGTLAVAVRLRAEILARSATPPAWLSDDKVLAAVWIALWALAMGIYAVRDRRRQ